MQSAKQIRLSRRGKKETPSYNIQQAQYFESIGKFKNNSVGRDERYELDIKYIQSITKAEILKEWAERIEAVIKHHENEDIKNTVRFKASAIKTVYDFRKQQVNHNTALEKMLNVLQEDK